MTSTIGAAVLGLQLHCAQCHDHKYDAISQADFYRFRTIFESAVPEMQRDKHVLRLANSEGAPPGRLYHRGELSAAGPLLPPGVPRVAVPADQAFEFSHDAPRLQLCDWLFERHNPLTARVIANRIWLGHFGQSLTENPSDFGVVAGGPSHPQLLDWLAAELRDSGWDIKHLHRTILLSATYQQSGALTSGAKGPVDTTWLTHFPRKRLTGEAIRDAMLCVSGQLNPHFAGPSVMPPLPPELAGTLLKGQWKTSPHAADHARRSIYVFARRNLRYPIFDAFDRPEAGASCAQRNRSTTAIQSLHLLNSEFTYNTAQKTADIVLQQAGAEASSTELVQCLFRRALSRSATQSEVDLMLGIIGTRASQTADELRRNLTTAAVAIFNSNEFIYID